MTTVTINASERTYDARRPGTPAPYTPLYPAPITAASSANTTSPTPTTDEAVSEVPSPTAFITTVPTTSRTDLTSTRPHRNRIFSSNIGLASPSHSDQ
nr:unnamed protein product [Spirometra erinaceieuropaei]